DSFTLHLPDPISVTSFLSGTVNSNVTATTNSTVNGTIGSNVTLVGDPNKPLTTLLIGDPAKPVSTDSKFELLNLPRFTLQEIKDMMKVRVRLPNYSQICFKMFGLEFFSICLSGEGQVITEPYVPNPMERCEVECCEPDTRPFPKRDNQ